ncbi:2'-5' RNA ligase family protein [uncultured Sphingomonas sp.]|uniref:2'-5' RNA ligase family protein n=1 Tax=uncultured Sphingomonas sp. TaxID=158754 RepID=UPI0035CA1E15
MNAALRHEAIPWPTRRSPRPRYIMIKPPPGPAREIGALSARPAELLHVTVRPLGDAALFDAGAEARLLRALDAFRAPPFRVVFDRLHGSGETLSLRGSRVMEGARRFERRLVETLTHRVGMPRYRFAPHLTLAYGHTVRRNEHIDAVSWLVEEYLLVESVYGEGRHVLLGRWPLVGA